MAKKKTIKDFEGSVGVQDDITPITRKPIPQLDSTRWPDMTIYELTEQREILFERMQLAQSGGNPAVVQQLRQGLLRLEAILKLKSAEFEADDDDSKHFLY